MFQKIYFMNCFPYTIKIEINMCCLSIQTNKATFTVYYFGGSPSKGELSKKFVSSFFWVGRWEGSWVRVKKNNIHFMKNNPK